MNETLDRLRGFQSRLLLAIHGIPESDLRRPETPTRWSIADVIAHLSGFELVVAVRIRTILAGDDTPPLVAFDQERWVERVNGNDATADLLEQFWFHRRMNVALLERLSAAELARTGAHPAYGVLTIRDVAERLERNQEKHLGQIERIKAAHRIVASSTPDLSGVVAGAPIAESSPGQGVRVRTIWQSGVKRALEVEFDAGAQWPGIDHHVPGPEEVYVLSGDFDDGANIYGAGAFLHHPAGSSHSPRSVEGCRLFVFYPEG